MGESLIRHEVKLDEEEETAGSEWESVSSKEIRELPEQEKKCGSTNKQIKGRKALEQGKCVLVVNFFWISRCIFA